LSKQRRKIMQPVRDSDFDEDGKLRRMPKILADGETMRVPMSMVDSSAGRSRVIDARLHRPGFRSTNDARLLDARKEADKAYAERDAWLQRAYLDAGQNPPTGEGSHGFAGAQAGDLCTVRNAEYPHDFGAPGNGSHAALTSARRNSRRSWCAV
jgi:hypothetical protein